MINNIEEIKKLLIFDSEDDFYHLQIIKRKKEHPELGSNSAIIKTYYIRSNEYLDNKYEEIKHLCDFHLARACINLNRRSFERIAFHTLKKITDQIMNKDYRSARKAFESCCGANSNEPNKRWIIDIDDKNNKHVPIYIVGLINSIQPNIGENKLIDTLETKNGYHLITKPFNKEEFQKAFFKEYEFMVDIHKDNPTILYIP